MIRRIEFKNFKALRDTSVRLGRVNLIVGPNGSGKSTVLQALRALQNPHQFDFKRLLSVGSEGKPSLRWDFEASSPFGLQVVWAPHVTHINEDRGGIPEEERLRLRDGWARIRAYAFDAQALAQPTQIQPGLELGWRGENLVVVLDALRDSHAERFEALNRELVHWVPEFDRVQFETSGHGVRSLLLRTTNHGQPVRASELSDGTLFVLAMLTLAFAPLPPPVIGIEEPDHGVHPRLLRRVRDAMYRLAYPEQFGEKRAPVQVLATTHSPFLLDLFREHPEEIVIAEKVGVFSTLRRLTDYPDIQAILGDAPLGDLWYSGVLGGVPAES